MKFKEYDVIIVGTGVSGLYAALNLDSSMQILMLSKRELTLCNSALAQGGVAAVMDTSNDNYELHIKDTLIAGGYKNNIDNVRILVEQGPKDVKNLLNYGVDFDRKQDGSIDLTLEGGHCRHRIAHHKDSTGFEIVTSLIEGVKKLSNVTILENTHLLGLTKRGDDFLFDVLHEGKHSYYTTKNTILATGGIGRVYKYTTNPAVATGDGIRLAYDMGATIKELSYVQFHPTAFNGNDMEQFLISESVRGEGAYLLNCNKERFMDRYDKRLELAPRDVVSRSIILESRRTGSDNFYLDIRYKGHDYLVNRFPGIYEGCLKHGVDMTKDLIPVFPCQHYLMGGIDVDLDARTSISRMYAVGECSHTGVHGKNRLASNSLLEALVFGKRAADDITSLSKKDPDHVTVTEHKTDISGAPLPKGMRTEIRSIMQRSYFVIPDMDAVRVGLKRVDAILMRLKNGKFAITPDYCEALSLATVAHIILKEVDEG